MPPPVTATVLPKPAATGIASPTEPIVALAEAATVPAYANPKTPIIIIAEPGSIPAYADPVQPVIALAESGNVHAFAEPVPPVLALVSVKNTFVGTKGNDKFTVDHAGDTIVETANGGFDKVYSSLKTYALSDNVEWLQFTTAPNVSVTGHGSATDNVIFGNSAGDLLFGQGGKDMLFGNKGDDTMFGGTGDDSLYGGENNDYLSGNEGKDRLCGGDGHDTIVGGADKDELRGENGTDELWGEDGADTLYGGLGSDYFRYAKTSDSLVGARDLIADFKVKADVIDLSSIDADATKAGNQAFHLLAAKPMFTSAGDLWIETTVNQAGTTLRTVYGDVHGDGVADFAITVQANAALTAADFMF